ncbi:hypothetical protein A3C59_00225 [Candidatus Daviesbacteria bacterium RIFCSPHIGHO2_02_FULL_36_13]|uniref:SCP domain-containing protein n=1 Tax=Candidatus Daviesbacteria bacterium RIFCSPHIGHO2_02_FULL_36_13 TaxID=1797768 RepID=A0A1F5JPP9_9BACT|nr:MAG: hypothetical protein A3C59_00225 [Candidatus Daviesbacteria bacterium RIFCSPHIGHO2_02_FULL_36_13]OGE40745.1 MAG: hypothetical protein A3A45_02560 [Candidatus Daviesbacteria bacterium RIFCSPLOWO2_01_FULL_36_8]
MSWHKIHKWFIPHRDTHKKAHLISWEAFIFYILIFIFLQVGFSILGYAKPGLLGISSNITNQKIIELTNAERAKQGLSVVKENEALNKAAYLKGMNMFEENYWAHFAPSGKSPWDFILGSGYKFTYAGENLAKNFYNSEDVVSAWMKSPTHRDNLLNSKYKDIGIAVVEGNLDGIQTTLVIQEFGTTEVIPAQNPVVNVSGQQVSLPQTEVEQKPQLVASIQQTSTQKPVLDPYILTKSAGIGIISIIIVLLFVDFVVLRRRGVIRSSSHHAAHFAILSAAAGLIMMSGPGAIL